MHSNPKLIGSDPVIAQAIGLFETEFFKHTDSLTPQDRQKVYKYPTLLIELKSKTFSENFSNSLIDRNLQVLKDINSPNLVSFASQNQHRSLAIEILKDIQNKTPEKLADACREDVSVKATETNVGIPKIIKLFKSKQELNFFNAIREAFPTYHHYPNVALSCVIDFLLIKSSLTPQERDYFFRAIIDCVVFDSNKNYEPKYFFELDSSYHDSDKAKKNDDMKDHIFKLANVKLIRIRAYNQEKTSVQSFKDLVVEVMRN